MTSRPVPANVTAYQPRSKRQLRLQQFVRSAAYRVWRGNLRRRGGYRRDETLNILDVGCGPGYFLREVRRWFPRSRLAGLDYEPMLLDWVGLDEATLTAGSAEHLPFANESMDVVACLQVLEHLQHPDTAIAEIHRVLKRGGYACIATPNLDCLSRRILGPRWHGFREDHIALRNTMQWRHALEDAGFQIVTDGSTLLSGLPWLRIPPLMLINWLPLYFFGYFPWHHGESYMAFCRKS